MSSIGLRRYERLANKLRQKYGLFDKLSLAVIGSCELANNPHIFLTRENQDIKEIHRHHDGTFNFYGPVVFASNQEQN